MQISTLLGSLAPGGRARRSDLTGLPSPEDLVARSPRIRHGSRAAWLAAMADLPPYHPE
jgi:hypothetical protein